MHAPLQRSLTTTALCLWLLACASGSADENPASSTGSTSCSTGLSLCNSQCVNLQSDASNCGACGNACASGTVCSSGSCQGSCGTGLSLCGQSCADITSDASNCGKCDAACPTGYSCVSGGCYDLSSAGGSGSTTSGTGGATTTTTTATVTCNSDVTSTGCTVGTLSSSGWLSGPYGKATVTAGGQEYMVQVNEWGSTASQQLSYGSPFFKITTQSGSNSTSGSPTGFPSMFMGANSGNSTSNSGLPKAVSSLGTVLTSWTWADNGVASDSTNNSFNAVYDVWFGTSSSAETSLSIPSGGYLMVWFYAQNCQPVGSLKTAAKTLDGVPGCWNVWVGSYNGRPVITYQHFGIIQSLGFDLNLFIKDAYTNYNSSYQSWYLTNIFTGFEVWKGGVGLQSTSFCAEVN